MNKLQKQYIDDQLFPSDNTLEVPTLRPDMQAEHCTIPFACFGEQRRSIDLQFQGTLHFYTDDYRFKSIYEHPDKIFNHHPQNIVEPNFSLFNETPIAFGLHQIYKKRWLARAMQDYGIRVFVDLNVAPKYYKANFLGVPKGWRSYCTRGYSDRLNMLEFEYMMAIEWADGNPLLFVCYGGGKECRQFCEENGLIYVTPVIACKNKAKAFEKMKQSIAFFGEDIETLELCPKLKELPTLEYMLNNRVESFK